MMKMPLLPMTKTPCTHRPSSCGPFCRRSCSRTSIDPSLKIVTTSALTGKEIIWQTGVFLNDTIPPTALDHLAVVNFGSVRIELEVEDVTTHPALASMFYTFDEGANLENVQMDAINGVPDEDANVRLGTDLLAGGAVTLECFSSFRMEYSICSNMAPFPEMSTSRSRRSRRGALFYLHRCC